MSFSRVVRLADGAAEVAAIIARWNGRIRVVSHHDADGITSAALLFKALRDRKKDFDIVFLKQLESDVMDDVVEESIDHYIFLDLGSGQLSTIKNHIPNGKDVVVVDHHQPQQIKWRGLAHFNPYFYGVDGSIEISGAGMAYLVARCLSENVRNNVDLAVVGAFADVQTHNNELVGINKLLYQDAELFGVVKKEKGLNLFGRYFKPIHKALSQSMDPYIDGISGNESGAVQLLAELGIPIRDEEGNFRRLCDLTRKEERKLATALVIESAASGLPLEKITTLISDIYKIRDKYEVREFATFLNACGRIGKPMEGVKFCLGIRNDVEELYSNYRRMISSALSWISRNRKSFIVTDKATYILAGDNISDTIIGTVLSICMKSKISTDIGFSFANSCNGVKVSARAKKDDGSINLGLIIRKACEVVGGEGGGHRTAAGAKIPFGSEMKFIDAVETLI